MTAARANVERARECLGALGELLMRMALEQPGMGLQKRLADVFDGLARAAWDRATRAGKRATYAIDQIDSLKERVRDLEQVVARQTALVGNPVLTPALR